MPTTTIAYGTTVAATAAGSGTWTNTGNATGSTAATFATWSSVARSDAGSIRLSGYGAQTAMGGVISSVISVDVTVKSYATTAIIGGITVQLFSGATAIGATTALTPSTTSTNVQTVTLTGAQCPTWAQCADLQATVVGTRTNSTSAGDANVDYVGIVITYVNSSVGLGAAGTAATGTTALSVTIPAGAATNDLALLYVNATTPSTDATPITASATGWTSLGSIQDNGTVITYPNLTMMWRTLLAGEPGTAVTVNFAGATPNATIGMINTYDSLDGAKIATVETSALAVQGASSTSVTSPSVTVTAGAWVAGAFTGQGGVSITPGAGVTERREAASGGFAHMESWDTNVGQLAGAQTYTSTASATTTQMCMGAVAVQATTPGGGGPAFIADPPLVVTRQSLNRASLY